MFVRGLARGSKFFIVPTSCLIAATPVIKSTVEPQTGDVDQKKIVCRPSELPLYSPPMSTVTKVKPEETSDIENFLIGPVSAVREVVVDAVFDIKDLACKTGQAVNKTAKNFNFVVDYLREEDNTPQRYGAVAMGTLTGFIFGLRGGIIKRLTYATVGTGIMGTICFPEDASVYFSHGLDQGKKVTRIAYNFVYGIKPGDPQPDIEFPKVKIPKNWDDIADIGSSLGMVILNAISSTSQDKKKPEEPPKN